MKHNVEFGEINHYRLYLLGHLIDHQFPQRSDTKFIDDRTDAAYDEFTRLRREGRSVPYAQEMAMRVLLAGLYISRYDIIYSVVEENLWTRLPEGLWPKFTEHLLGLAEINAILDSYGLDGDFLEKETHQPMLMELLGTINDILDGYGL